MWTWFSEEIKNNRLWQPRGGAWSPVRGWGDLPGSGMFVADRCRTNHFKLERLKSTMNTYLLAQFLRGGIWGPRCWVVLAQGPSLDVVGMVVRAASYEVSWGWRTCVRDGSPTGVVSWCWLLAGGLPFSLGWVASPRVSDPRESKGGSHIFYNLAPEVTLPV